MSINTDKETLAQKIGFSQCLAPNWQLCDLMREALVLCGFFFVFFSGQKEEAEASVCLHITPSCKWGVLVMKSHSFGAQTELIVFRKKQPSVYIWTEQQQHLV